MDQAVFKALSSMTASAPEIIRAWFAHELEAVLNEPTPGEIRCEACDERLQVAACEALDALCVFTGLPLRRVRCPYCGLIFGPLAMILAPKARLDRLYELVYRFYAEGDTVFAQERTFYLMNPSRAGRYLNYACGPWTTGLQRLTDAGWDIYGHDPYLPSFHPRFLRTMEQVRQQPFNGLMSHNFLEHPQAILSEMRLFNTLLTDGGLMAHSTPCYEYLFERSPFHLYFFEGQSLAHLAQRSGFQVIGSVAQDREPVGSYYLCKIFRKLEAAQ